MRVDVSPPAGEECCGPDLVVEHRTLAAAPAGRTLWLCVALRTEPGSPTYYFPQQSVTAQPTTAATQTTVHIERARAGWTVQVFVVGVDGTGSAALQAMPATDDGSGDWIDRTTLPQEAQVVSGRADITLTRG